MKIWRRTRQWTKEKRGKRDNDDAEGDLTFKNLKEILYIFPDGMQNVFRSIVKKFDFHNAESPRKLT